MEAVLRHARNQDARALQQALRVPFWRRSSVLSDATVPQSRELQRIIAMLVVAGNTQVLGILLTDRVLERTCCGCVISRRINQVTSPHLGFVQTAVERAIMVGNQHTLRFLLDLAPCVSRQVLPRLFQQSCRCVVSAGFVAVLPYLLETMDAMPMPGFSMIVLKACIKAGQLQPALQVVEYARRVDHVHQADILGFAFRVAMRNAPFTDSMLSVLLGWMPTNALDVELFSSWCADQAQFCPWPERATLLCARMMDSIVQRSSYQVAALNDLAILRGWNELSDGRMSFWRYCLQRCRRWTFHRVAWMSAVLRASSKRRDPST
jgi:hypothetical protein